MVEFKLIEKNGNILHYEYYPNGDKEDKGIIIFDFVKKEVIKDKKPKNNVFYWLGHMIQGIQDKETGEYKEYGTVAWY